MGAGQVADQPVPVQLTSATPGRWQNIVQVAAGSNFTLAVDGEGRVWSCGQNNSAQLGNGTTTASDVANPVLTRIEDPDLANITRIHASSVAGRAFAIRGGGVANQPPFVQGAAWFTAIGESVAGNLIALDPEGDPLTFDIVQLPLNGSLTGTGAARTFVPRRGFVGQDVFTFRVSDGRTWSDTRTVSITVTTTPGAETTYAAWSAKRFEDADLGDEARRATIWGPDADPDADGIRNLLEYASGTEPWIHNRDGVPTLRTEVDSGITYAVFRYRRNSAAADLVYQPELATGPMVWGLPPESAAERTVGADGAILTVESWIPRGDLPPAFFLRLRVALQP
jgi:hypothetical protein